VRGSDDDEDDEAGQQQRRRRAVRSLAGARRAAHVARVVAAAERARGRPRRRHAVHTQRRRLVHLLAARRVHRAYLVDGQLLTHGCSAQPHPLASIVYTRRDTGQGQGISCTGKLSQLVHPGRRTFYALPSLRPSRLCFLTAQKTTTVRYCGFSPTGITAILTDASPDADDRAIPGRHYQL